MKLTTLLVLPLLTSCASWLPVKEVKIPVPTPCLAKEQVPLKPTFVKNDDFKAMSDYQLVASLWLDRSQRADYIERLEIVVSACSTLSSK